MHKKNTRPLMTNIYNNGRLEDLYEKNSLMYLLIWSGDLDASVSNRSLIVVKDKGIYSINYIHVFSKCKFTQCNICKEYNKN
jgi:hypothetical protein